MARRIWFEETCPIDGKQYMMRKKDNKRKLISDDGKYVFRTEKGLVIESVRKFRKLPTVMDIFGTKNLEEFKEFVGKIYINELGFTQKEWDDNKDEDPPILDPLYKPWRDTRDANWLYNLREYAFETLHCSLQVTVKVGSKGDIHDRFCPMYNTFMEMELLDYDKKYSFKCLDLCSGMGLTTLFLAYRFPNGTFYYNELNPQTRLIFSKLLKRSGLKNVIMLNSEEIDEDLDIVVGFEAVEHIPHPTLPGVGQPYEWAKQFMDLLKKGGHFLYQTQWNAEFSLDGNVLGHFLEYEIGGVLYGLPVPEVNGGQPVWGDKLNQHITDNGFTRVQGKTGCGHKGLKWALRGAPKIFRKDY